MNCFIFHNWSEWSTPYRGQDGHTQQSRRCETCGMIKVRRIYDSFQVLPETNTDTPMPKVKPPALEPEYTVVLHAGMWCVVKFVSKHFETKGDAEVAMFELIVRTKPKPIQPPKE